MQKLPEETVRAAAGGMGIPDKKLEALRQFTRKMVKNRGWLEEGDMEAFLGAGFTPENALEVVIGIAMKTLSNYANHLMETPLDEPFRANAPDKSA
jgi:alkylhydroperoxidase family enzyme